MPEQVCDLLSRQLISTAILFWPELKLIRPDIVGSLMTKSNTYRFSNSTCDLVAQESKRGLCKQIIFSKFVPNK